jgi:hypothetical protein
VGRASRGKHLSATTLTRVSSPTAFGLRYTAAFGCCLFAGSLIFLYLRDGFWFYLFFWEGGWLRLQGWSTTAGAFWPSTRWMLASLASWTAIWWILGRVTKVRTFAHEHYRSLCFVPVGCAGLLVIGAGLYGSQPHERLTGLLSELDARIAKVGRVGQPRPLQPPFDFVHLDARAIEGMYAQFQPSLREAERTVQTAGRASVEAKLGVEGASVGGSGSRERAETSALKAVELSLERKASELIVGLVRSGQAKTYKDSGAWLVSRLSAPLQVAMTQLDTAARYGHLGPNPLNAQELGRQLQALDGQMKEELNELQGQVVIEGRWRLSKSVGEVRLTHNFYPAEFKGEEVTFEFRLPNETTAVSSSEVVLRVFGTVLSVTGGRIAVRPLAVFY